MSATATDRHDLIFSAREFNPTRAFFAGVGAIGSHTCLGLAKLGVTNMVCYDTDVVAIENVGPSIYGRKHVGMKKVDACAAIVHDLTDNIVVQAVHKPFQEAEDIDGVVFICVDTMDVRKRILFEQCARLGTQVERVFEGRMSAFFCMTHSLDPRSEENCADWMNFWFPQGDAEPDLPGCGARPVSFGPTASTAANLSLYQFTEWFAWKQGKIREHANQIRFDAETMQIEKHHW